MRIDLKRKPWAQKFMVIALAVAVCAISIFSGRSALEVNAESTDTQITNSANLITESAADERAQNRVNTGSHVFAAVTASGTWGTCPWSLSSDGVLTIGAGTGANSSGYGSAPWYSQRANIKSVELTGEVKLPQSVANLFADCSNLTSFDASNLDTSAVTDMNNMFYDCSSLTSLDVSNWDTSAVTNMGYMFAGCTSLTTLDVSNWKTSAVTNMSWVFGNCSKLSALDVSNWDTSAVQDMRYMFRNCSSLTTLDISNWDTSKAASMYGMFEGCRSLTTIDVSNWGTSNVTDMGYMFNGCGKLTALDVSNWNTSRVINMGSMFYGCSSLTTLDTSNWNTSRATNMNWMFVDCSNLTTLGVSNWDTSHVTDMNWMFKGCSSLTTLDVSKWDTSAVANMYNMFYDCSSLTALDVSSWNTGAVTDMRWMFHNCNRLTTLDVSSWDTSAVTNMGYMFNGCSSLTTLDVSSWDTSAVTDMTGMFSNCSGLTTLGISSWNTSKVTSMYGMFNYCRSFTTLDLSNWNTGAVQDMSYMFQGCSNLASLDLSKWNTSNVTTMPYTFNGCSSLTYLDVSAWSTGKVTTMQSMFSGCSKLKHMKVGTGFVFSSTGGALPSPSAANGYYISGWYTAETGGTRRASAGGKYTIAQTEDIYAQEAPKNYHIFLNNNGGTSKWKDMLTYADAFGSGGINYHISSSTDLGSATKNGYVFDGWEYYPMINYGFNTNRVISYTNSTYTKFGIVIHNSTGKRVETIINTNTLGTAKQDWVCDLDSGTYAIWIGGLTDSGAMRGYKSTASLEKGKTYRIEYNVVSIADGKVTFKDYAFAGPGTMTTNNMIPAGYATNFYADAIWRLPEFVGWNTAPDGSGTTYKPGDALPDANLDLYAQWG